MILDYLFIGETKSQVLYLKETRAGFTLTWYYTEQEGRETDTFNVSRKITSEEYVEIQELATLLMKERQVPQFIIEKFEENLETVRESD